MSKPPDDHAKTEDNEEDARSLLARLSEAMAKSRDVFRFETEPAVKVEPPRPAVQPPEPIPRKLPPSQVEELILHELKKLRDFPNRAVKITVYGFRPWNAMLNFGLESSVSPSRATAIRETLVEIVGDLRKQIEVDIDAQPSRDDAPFGKE